jgi:hypothetical protein
MEIITNSERDNIPLYYIPFIYKDVFPGYEYKFPQGLVIEKV